MGNIVKKEHNFIEKKGDVFVIPKNLPISNKSRELYLSGVNFPKVSEIHDMNKVVNTIHTLVNMTIMDKGVNMPVEEQNFLKQRVTDDILRDFSRYTLEQIKLSFYYGVRGEMGEYFGLNPSTFYKWLKDFRYELMPNVNQEIKKFLPKPSEQKNVPSEKEIDKRIANTIIEEFVKFRDEKVYDYYDFGNIGYKLLERLKLIQLTNEEKDELIEESKIQFRSNIIKRNTELINQGKSFLKIDLKRAFKEIEEKTNPTFQHQIRIGAMRLAVFNFISKCVEDKVDLENQIKTELKKLKYDNH